MGRVYTEEWLSIAYGEVTTTKAGEISVSSRPHPRVCPPRRQRDEEQPELVLRGIYVLEKLYIIDIPEEICKNTSAQDRSAGGIPRAAAGSATTTEEVNEGIQRGADRRTVPGPS